MTQSDLAFFRALFAGGDGLRKDAAATGMPGRLVTDIEEAERQLEGRARKRGRPPSDWLGGAGILRLRLAALDLINAHRLGAEPAAKRFAELVGLCDADAQFVLAMKLQPSRTFLGALALRKLRLDGVEGARPDVAPAINQVRQLLKPYIRWWRTKGVTDELLRRQVVPPPSIARIAES